MHVVLLKVLPLENEVALIKRIRLYTQKSISEIRQNLVSGLPVLRVPYSELEELKRLRILIGEILSLNAEIQLFLDTEEDEIDIVFLDNTIISQEETNKYFESIDESNHLD